MISERFSFMIKRFELVTNFLTARTEVLPFTLTIIVPVKRYKDDKVAQNTHLRAQ